MVDALKDPSAATAERIDELRRLDWTDADIMDSMVHGTQMIGMYRLFKALAV